VLHGPRVPGHASAARIAARFGLDVEVVDELLLDYGSSIHHSVKSVARASSSSLTSQRLW
jgi:hypothetical protein